MGNRREVNAFKMRTDCGVIQCLLQNGPVMRKITPRYLALIEELNNELLRLSANMNTLLDQMPFDSENRAKLVKALSHEVIEKAKTSSSPSHR